MKKICLLITFLCIVLIHLSAQTFSLRIFAGSNAPWGKSQHLSIDAQGNAVYKLFEVNKGVRDSASFTISNAQLSELADVVKNIQFFNLNASYNAQSRDGTRLSVHVSDAGKTHTVHWINIHTAESDLLLNRINAVVKSRGIVLNY